MHISAALSTYNNMKSIIIFATVVACALGQVPVPGPCPNTAVLPNFNKAEWDGVWYEQKRYQDAAEIGDSCVKTTYTLDPSTGVFGLEVLAVNRNNVSTTNTGTATQKAGTDGYLILDIPTMRNFPLTVVDGTVYGDFSVTWSCVTLPGGAASTQWAWIHTRARQPSQATLDSAVQVALGNGLNQAWNDVVQTSCTN